MYPQTRSLIDNIEVFTLNTQKVPLSRARKRINSVSEYTDFRLHE